MGIDTGAAEDHVNALRKRIIDPEDDVDLLCPEDRNALIEFDNNLTRDRRDNNRCGWYHHGNLLSRLYILSSHTDQLGATLDEDQGQDAVDDITDWIHDQGYSGYTVQGLLSSLRVFASTVYDIEPKDLPDRFANIEPGEHVDDDRSPMPGNIVEYEEMLELVEAAPHPRDEALIATQWDAGMRPMEELYTLQYKNVQIRDDHVMINLPEQDGKTDKRRILVIDAAPLLKRWILKKHPVHDDPEASLNPETFIWTKQNENTLPRYNAIGERFRVAGKNADLSVDHSAQHLRRSSASIYARKGSTERHLRKRYGWGPTSPAPEHYVATFSTSTQVQTAQIRGREVDEIEEHRDTAPVPCERCGDWTLRGLDNCVHCEYDRSDEQLTLNEHTRKMSNPHTAEELTFEEKILRGILTVEDLLALKEVKPNHLAGEDIFAGLGKQVERARALGHHRDQSDESTALTGPMALLGYYSATVGGLAKRWGKAKHAAMRIHPAFEDYPPRGARLAGVVSGAGLVILAAITTFAVTGLLDRLLAGDFVATIALLIGLVLGTILVNRDMPTVDEAVSEL